MFIWYLILTVLLWALEVEDLVPVGVVHTEVEEAEEEAIGVEDLPVEICQIEEVIPLREEADLNILLPVMIHALNTIQVSRY